MFIYEICIFETLIVVLMTTITDEILYIMPFLRSYTKFVLISLKVICMFVKSLQYVNIFYSMNFIKY